MDYKTIITHPKCCGANNGSIKLFVSNNIGTVFINWLNIPKESTILNNGTVVFNLPAGKYIAELEDKKYFGHNKKTISIELIQPNPLEIDLIKLTQPMCHYDTGSIDIAIKGGTPPYHIKYGNASIRSDDNFVTLSNITNNMKHQLCITDKNKCVIETTNDIHIYKQIPTVDIEIKHPSLYGYNDSSVSLKLDGYDNPKIAWYKLPDLEKPIAMNTTHISNKLIAGKYEIKIIDNECITNKSFELLQPQPSSINFNTTNDYTKLTKYPRRNVKQVYNALLISKNTHDSDLLNMVPGEIIRIKNNKDKYNKYNIIFQPEHIIIDDQPYYLLYIFPTIKPSLTTKECNIVYNNKTYKMHYGFHGPNKNSICIYHFILEDNFNYAFHNGDTCELYLNDTTHNIDILKVEQKNNIYDYGTNNTLLLPELSGRILQSLNHNLGLNNISISSIDTTMINKKGSINLSINIPNEILEGVYNIDNKTFKYKIICYGKDNGYYNVFYTNKDLLISDLTAGDYTIEIDKYMANFLNDYVHNNNVFTFHIAAKNPNQTIGQQSVTLNKFKKPSSDTGIFIKIPPYKQTMTVLHNNKSINFESSYQILNNIEPGKYTIQIGNHSKDVFVSKHQFININTLT